MTEEKQSNVQIWQDNMDSDILVSIFDPISEKRHLIQARVTRVVDAKYVCIGIYDDVLKQFGGYRWFDATQIKVGSNMFVTALPYNRGARVETGNLTSEKAEELGLETGAEFKSD